MSADDNEDYWSNDDFIATIENVVKKAEEARAARHGGTQLAPSPHSSARVPLLPVDLQSGESGTNHLPDFLNSRPTDGSVAPAPWEVNYGTISREMHGADTIAHVRGNCHQSVQEMPVSLEARGEADAVGEDIAGQYGDLMAEKDGMISVLRSRVQEAERQLETLRNRVAPQNLLHPSIYQQQLELERLSAQLMFKDHEIIEGQRARAEKEERLKDALAETSVLKVELEKLKKSSQTGTELKRPQNEAGMNHLEKNTNFAEHSQPLPLESLRNTNGVTNANQNPWFPPWMPEGVPEIEANTGLPPTDESPSKMPVEGNGSVGFNAVKESTKTDTQEEIERHKLGISSRPGTIIAGRSDGEELPAIEQLNVCFSRTTDMYYSLQHLWGLKSVRNDGVSLLSKLYANCREDLYILFSSGESQAIKNLKSFNKEGEGEIEGGIISENFHTAVAKVANGLAHPQIIITPLLEFCKLEKINLVASALHVLRCILQHDSSCRQSLLLRRSHQRSHCQVQPCSSFESLGEKKIAGEKGWCMQGAPIEGSNLQFSYRVLFSSPRIKSHPQAGDTFLQHTQGRISVTESSVGNGGQEPPRHSDQLQRQVSENGEAGFDDTRLPAEEINLFAKWMLDLALKSLSSNVKFEAIANLGVLVMHSEPLTERSMFGPLLSHGALDLLLKESCRAEIQLQAVRIVHLLLHCPIIIERFCAADDAGEKMTVHSNLGNEGDAENRLDLVNQIDRPPVDNQGTSDVRTLKTSKMAICPAPQQSSYTALSKVKLLEALAECLNYTGSSAQGCGLHRSIIRLFAFIMAYGDLGIASLMRVGNSYEEQEPGTCKDDAKMGVVLGESTSGQNIAGNGSGSTHLKEHGLGDKENGVPVDLVDESVDDSENFRSIPQRLLALIDFELDADEREDWSDPSTAEEREHLIYEAVRLLFNLTSDQAQSPVVLRHLINNKDIARLTLSVMNRLVSRKSRTKHSWVGRKSSAPNNFDIGEVARGLRGSVLKTLEDYSPFSLY